jgi:putative DNA primase/helicase
MNESHKELVALAAGAEIGEITEPQRRGARDMFSHQMAAKLFACKDEGKLRYDRTSAAKWFVFGGSHWAEDAANVAFREAVLFTDGLAEKFERDGKRREAATFGKISAATAVAHAASALEGIATTPGEWDASPYLLATPSGTVDLRTGELRPADPADLITRCTAVAPAPVAECPLWQRFLTEAMCGDGEKVAFLQRWFGYALTGETKEHCLVFARGDGGNGKSLAINTVARLMGSYAATASMDSFMAAIGDRHPADIAALRGARFVTATETEEGRDWAEARLKLLTGGDPVTVRVMRGDPFTFAPTFKLTFAGNHEPALKNVDAAMRRRLILVPFDHRPEKPDLDLEEKLRAEWPAILRWAVNGCLLWQRDRLTPPASLITEADNYFAKQDAVGRWLDECCEVRAADETVETSADSLFTSWSSFARSEGRNPRNKTWFGRELTQKRLSSRHTRTGKTYTGIRLLAA